jgi:predicted dithiol-disulfide oxidoreductase (DUF899 family)
MDVSFRLVERQRLQLRLPRHHRRVQGADGDQLPARADLEAPEASNLHWILEQEQPFENPGFSFFLRDGDAIFHTNSTFARGTEECSDSYGILDHTALGRQEDWEEPKGRADQPHGATPDFAPS